MWKRDGGGEDLETERPVRKRRDYVNTSGILVEAMRMEKRGESESSQKAVEIPGLRNNLV